MILTVTDVLHTAMGSPWIYAALFVFVVIDGFLPTIPGETLVVTSGVFAVTGQPNLAVLVVVAAAGGFAGDHVSYLIGRTAGGRMIARLRPGTRRRAPFDWAADALDKRGAAILVVCRFIPGCRTAATITAGTVTFRRRSFSTATAIGAMCWSVYFALVGYVGGIAFEREPLLGVLLGIAFAVGVAVIIELVRHFRSRGKA